MNTAQHTPGPWKAGNDIPMSVNNKPDNRLVWSDSLLVCDCRSKWIDPGTAANNARLIAAAPDLLEALGGLLARFDKELAILSDKTYSADDFKEGIVAQRAIAKAKGS